MAQTTARLSLRKLSSTMNDDSGLGFLLVAAASFLISITSYYYFLGCDYFVTPKAKWTTAAGYTKLEFAYFVLGTYFLPMGILFMLIFISKSSKVPSTSAFYKYKLPLYVALTIAFSIGCATAAQHSDQVLGCIGHFCIGSSTQNGSSPGVVSANLVFFFIFLFFLVIFTVVAVIEAIVLFQRYYSYRVYSRVNIYEPLGTGLDSGLDNGLDIRRESPYRRDRTDSRTGDIRSNRSIAQNMDALQTNEKRHRTAYRNAWLSETIFIALTFLMFFPIFTFACTILPTWWTGFTRYEIQRYQKFVPPQAYGSYWLVTMNDTLVLKVFPDIVIYYGAIYLVSLLALTAQFYSPLKRVFLWRITPSICLGQAMLAVGLVGLVVAEWCYWFFSHAWENNLVKPRSNAELAARSFGQIGNVVLGLLVLPVAKNGVWSRVFGVSWEGMIIYHQILGYTFLLIILCHMLSWWAVYELKGSFPSDIFAVPMTYHKDNFTIPLSVLTSFFMFIIMGGLTFHVIRRLNYELFYYFHLFSGVIFLSVVWHATMSWYYVSAGLVLYALDHAVRLSSSVGTVVKVEELSVCVEDADQSLSLSSSSATSPTTSIPSSPSAHYTSPPTPSISPIVNSSAVGVTKLSYTVSSPTAHTGERSPICHLMGQYVYINIPAISSLEWHPFTISSSPVDGVTTHHIKVMGGVQGDQWTARLHQFARKYEASAVKGTLRDEDFQGIKGVKGVEKGGEGGVVSRKSRGGSFGGSGISAGTTADISADSGYSSGYGGGYNGGGGGNNSNSAHSPRLSLSSLQVNIDGPYGLSVSHELHRYTHLILVGGGIGVTPLHSCIRHLYLSDVCATGGVDNEVEGGRVERKEGDGGCGGVRAGGEGGRVGTVVVGGGGFKSSMPFPYPDLQHVRLIWSIKSEEEAYQFKDTLDLIADDDKKQRYSTSIHITTKTDKTDTQHTGNHPGKQGRTQEGLKGGLHSKLNLKCGRPNLAAEISSLSHLKGRVLVFACGPAGMVEECSVLTMKHGVDFRHETFEL